MVPVEDVFGELLRGVLKLSESGAGWNGFEQFFDAVIENCAHLSGASEVKEWNCDKGPTRLYGESVR